jgi:tight adherence protein B
MIISALMIIWVTGWLVIAARHPRAHRDRAEARTTPGRGSASSRRSRSTLGVVGMATAAAAVILVAPGSPAITGVAAIGGLWIVAGRRRRAAHALQRAARHDLAATLDLMAIVLRSGGNLDHAIAVAAAARGPLAEVLGAAPRSDPERALLAIDTAVGLPGLRLSSALLPALDQGEPLIPVIDRLSADTRAMRRREAERAARRAPVRALAPLLLTTLPAFVLLTVAPLLASGLRSLHLDPIR